MSNKLLCIACSEDNIALCQFALHLRDRTLVAHHTISVNTISDPQTFAKELSAAIDRNNLRSDQYNISLPSSLAITRNWAFPFSSKKQILQALDFELEQELPFSPIEGVTGTQFGEKSKHGRNVTSATLPKKFFITFLEELQLHDIDPQLVTLDAFALAHIVSTIEKWDNVLLLHINMHRTLLVYIDKTTPYAISQVPSGLHNIKVALQQKFSTTEDNTERNLLFSDLTSDSPDTFHKSLILQLQQLAKQITLCAHTTDAKADSILLCGDIAKLQGIDSFFSDELATPVTLLHNHSKAAALIPVEDKNDWIEYIPASGLATNTQFMLQQPMVNFRKDDFSFHKNLDPLTAAIKYATTLACVFMLAWSLSLFAQGYQKSLEAKALHNALKQAFHQALPKVDGSFGTIQYSSILKSRLAQLKGEASSDHSQTATDSLDLLLALHQSTPPSLDINIESLRISQKNIGIIGTTTSYGTLEQIRSQLSQNEYFSAVTIRSATNQKTQGRISFELEIEKAK